MESTTMIIRGKHVLMAMLAFFGTIILVNMVFVYFALDTWTGLTTENAYKEGLNYNQTIAARDAQRDLGWQADISLAAQPDGSEELTVTLRDQEGTPLSGMTVSGSLGRPTYEGQDRTVVLAEAAEGRYVTPLSLPLRGNWDLALTARPADALPEDPVFEMKTRLWLK